MRFYVRISLLGLVCAALLAGIAASSAQAGVQIEKFVGVNCSTGHEECGEEEVGTDLLGSPLFETVEPGLTESEKEGYTQAGGRVPFGVTDFMIAHTGSYAKGEAVPNGVVTHVRVDVAAGLATSPVAVPQCTMAEFGETEVAPGVFLPPACKEGAGPHKTGPESTVIGEESATVYVATIGKDIALKGTLYNLVQPTGRSALYGAALVLPEALTGAKGLVAHTLVEGNVEWGKEAKGTGAGDYHDYFEVNVSPNLPVIHSRQLDYGTAGNGAFITNGTNCPGNHTTRLSLEGVNIGAEKEVKEELESGSRELSRKPYTTEVPLQNCQNLPFAPSFSITPGTTASDQPNGLTAEATLPHFPEKEVDSSQVKTASITLPEGMTLNPSAAHGLEACTVAQARIHSEQFGVSCPSGSELGTVSLNVPTLPDGSLTGHAYLGGPVTGSETAPITGPPYIMYVVANSERYGVSVRLKAEVFPNETTGQVTTVFNENPEQPFTNLKFVFKSGALAPLANPLVCGTPSGTAKFTPVAPISGHEVAFGTSVTGCASPIPFNITQATNNQNGNGGGNTSFTIDYKRADGQQYLSTVSTTLPPGLAGAIPTATQCAEPGANKGECPPTSQIGTAITEAGSGPTPFTFNGPVYLTGPYAGAPFGLSIAIPATAGPFSLGTVTTRATINIDPHTGQVTTTSTLPRIVKGIPTRIRRIVVSINKQGFLLNPTSCNPLAVESTLTGFVPGSSTETTFKTSSPFQLANCSALGFTPKFVAKTSGKPSKANGASIETTLNYTPGQANTKSVKVQLPKQLPSRLTTLQKACLQANFETNPYSCPSGSFVGGARANTPLLPGKLTGPAILVSHAGAAFPDLDLVLEANGVRIILVGNTDIKKGITTTTFATTPDEPVSSVTVNLPLGPHSALATEKLTTNLCTANLVMPTTITAQNGKQFKQNTIIQPTSCGVQIVGHTISGNTAILKVKTFSAGRISGSGSGLKTTYRKLKGANKAATLKVPLKGGHGRPFKVKVRVGFLPSKKGPHSIAYTTVTFR